MNTSCGHGCRVAFMVTPVALAVLGGCGEKSEQERRRGNEAPARLVTASTIGPGASAVPVDMSKGWCAGHGVPESVCTRCNASLVEKFKEGHDWCGEHGLPESQCTLCNPGVNEEWSMMNPKTPTRRDSDVPGLIRLEPKRRLLTGSNDSQCQVDRLRVRFLDAATARQAGIETEVVQARRLSYTIECPAEVGFDQTRLVRITPRVPGVVTEASVEMGNLVKTDDLLAVMESPTLGQAKSRYIRMREGYLLAMADVERVGTIHRGTQRMLKVCTASTSSSEVRRGLRDVRIGDAKSRLLQAHAALELARATLERERTLFDKQISSEQSFETANSSLAAAEAGFQAAHEAVAFDSQRDRLAALRTLKVAKSELDAVERELGILGLSESHLAALGSESGSALSRYELYSPAAGRIVERRAVVGEVVQQRDALYMVADLSTMWLMMDLREGDLTQMRVGLPVLFTVDGLPGHAFDGIVSWISDTVDNRTRTIKVRANLSNERALLRANMFGLARIIVHDNDEVVAVSRQAVQTDGCCQLVFVKQDESLFEPRKVSLGASANGYVEILAGLAPGESVVTVGSFLMKTEILKSNIGAGCCEVDSGR